MGLRRVRKTGRPAISGDEATISSADIARMAGVGRAAVSNWRRRYEDFPEPVGGTATSPTFSLKAVEAWLLGQGKVEELPLRERVWQQIRMAADDLRLGDVVAEATELLHGQGKARLVPRPAWKLIKQLADEQGAAEVVRFLLDRFADVQSRRLAETPAEVADFMVRLAGPDVRTVLDPACGLGMLLAAASGAERVYGQEYEEALSRLAQARLSLAGVDGAVKTGDSLRDDAWPGVMVDAVLCHPPFNERNWGYEELASDPRWEYGLPPKSESELAWVQHALAHLRPGGVAVMLMPEIAANRRSGRRIRSNLLRRGAVQAVIGLPPKIAPGTGLPVHIWVLRKPAGDDRTPARVLMSVAEPATFNAIADRWREFCRDPDLVLDVPGETRTVPIIDLVDEDIDISPARHLSSAGGEAGDYLTVRADFLGRLERLTALVPQAVPARAREMPMVALSELERTGALSLLQSGRYDAEGSGHLVLEAGQVFTGGQPMTRAQPEDRVLIRPGDVVVATRDREIATRVVEVPGLLLGPRLTLLRPHPDRLDPYFLAGFIRTLSAGGGGTQSGVSRFDPRRAHVPRLPLDDQRRYGQVWRDLFTFETELREAGKYGLLAASSLATGLTAGTLSPPEPP
ncbi:class I SAM-dependent DNA methyltransferase [Sphaerisporangium dianthi]|uniref:Class I SAM-dependent DNA methyltransferase n=1 Tax=Sphaerisporangium dianthi TaxID=1436120 RepID=A0ABV9C9I8_9ACTN